MTESEQVRVEEITNYQPEFGNYDHNSNFS